MNINILYTEMFGYAQQIKMGSQKFYKKTKENYLFL